MEPLLLENLVDGFICILGSSDADQPQPGAKHEAGGRGIPDQHPPPRGSTRRAGAPAGSDRVIVVGAGPAGLAVSVHLHKMGVPFDLVERQDEASWRSQEHNFNRGEDFPYPESFNSASQYFDSLLAYAEDHGIQPAFGTTVVSAATDEAGRLWRVRANRRLAIGGMEEVEYVGRFLVVATGVEKDMRMVSQIPGLSDSFQGEVIHATNYGITPASSNSSYRGKNVLVVGGCGATRAVSVGLIDQGAHPVVVTLDESVRHDIRSYAATSSSPLHRLPTLVNQMRSVLRFLLAWLVVHLSGCSSHGERAEMHGKPAMELAGLLMCACLFPIEKAMHFLVWIGLFLSGALCRLRPAERVWLPAPLKQAGLLFWYILSAVEISVKFLFLFAHCVLFAIVLLVSVLDLLGRWDVAPLAIQNTRRLRVTSTSFDLLRMLVWYALCLVDKFAALISLLADLGFDDDSSGPGAIDVTFASGVARFSESRVELVDGRAIEIDAVILDSGYRSNTPQAHWAPGRDVFGNKGYPNTALPQGWKGQSGLYAVGFGRRRQGLTPVQTARHISQATKSAPGRQTPVRVVF